MRPLPSGASVANQRLVPKCVELVVGHSLVSGLGDSSKAFDLLCRSPGVLSIMVDAQGLNCLAYHRLARLNYSFDGSFHDISPAETVLIALRRIKP